MQQKKILFVINSLSHGGAEKVLSMLANSFSKKKLFTVEIVMLENIRTYYVSKDIPVTTLSQNTHNSAVKKFLMLPIDAIRLAKYIKKSNPDVVISFIFRADFVNILSSLITKKPTIVSVRVHASSTYHQKSISAAINKFLIRTLYPKANAIINVSKGTQQDLIKNFHIPKTKQCVIYNPYETDKIEKLAKQPLRKKLPPLQKRRTCIIVSRLRPIKNIEMIIEIFATLPKDIHLLIVGDGPHEKTLKAKVNALKLYDRIIFTGPQENPFQYMEQAAIYLSASNAEGFPNALVEAMLCGCAVISTDCPSGPREILAPQTPYDAFLKNGFEETPYGILVAVNDQDAYKNAILELLENHRKRELLSIAAKKRASDFQLENILAQYTKKIEEVIRTS